MHVLCLDGVYVRESVDAPLGFHPLPAPTGAEVATGEAVLPLLIEHGLAPRAPPPTLPAPLGQLELGFAG